MLVRTQYALMGLTVVSLGMAACGGTEPRGTVAINLSPNRVAFATAPGGSVDPKTVGITPATANLTGVTASVSFVGNPPSEWLAASLSSTDATLDNPAVLTLQVTNSNLPAGAYDATVTIGSDGAANAPRVNVTLTIEAAAALAILTQPSATSASGTALTDAPVVQLQTANGIPVAQAGVDVTVALEGDGSLVGDATATTDADGKATFTGLGVTALVGDHTLLFTSQGLSEVRSNPIAITPGAATTIAVGSVTPQSAETNNAVNDPPIALVTDAAGNPVAGVQVTFAVTQGNGSIDPTTPVTTNSDGQAALSSWTLGPVAGANAVTASATGLNGSPVQFNATGTNGGVVPGPVDGTKSSIIASSPVAAGANGSITVFARDADNNLIGGASVTVASSGTGNSFGSTTLTTGTSGGTLGRATTTFSSTKAEAKSISAQITAGGVTVSPTPASVTVVAGAPSGSTSTVSAPTSVAGLATGALVTITVKDANGNPVSGRTVTLAVTDGPGGELLTQPVSSTGGGGTTTGTLKSTTGGIYTVRATVDGTTIVTQTAVIQILISFASDIVTGVFDTRFDDGNGGLTLACNGCHLADGGGNDPDLTYTALLTEQHDGDPVALSGNAGVSRLFRAVNQDPGDTELNPLMEWMPSSEQRLPEAIVQRIRRWINQNGEGGTLQP